MGLTDLTLCMYIKYSNMSSTFELVDYSASTGSMYDELEQALNNHSKLKSVISRKNNRLTNKLINASLSSKDAEVGVLFINMLLLCKMSESLEAE